MSSQSLQFPVLVVGGGPVGLMGGILHAQRGLASLVLEQRDGPQPAPAAHVLNARSFEICRQAGVDMKALAAVSTDPVDAAHAIWVTRLDGEEVGRLPFERQGDENLEFTPTPLRNVSQHHFESILLEELRRTPAAEIRYGQRWEGAVQDASGVTSTVRDLASDRVYEVRSRTLIAADGAGSRVRKWLGIEMDGPPKLQSFVMIHIEANLRALVRDRPGVLYWLCDPATNGTFVAHDIDREWVYMQAYDSDRESVDDYPDARCREIIERAMGTVDVPFSIAHRGTWTMTCQVAARFREGRVFLAGDAAHRFPPTGGLGLNSGLQDVHGLAWKLAAVEAGWAPRSLLDSYESERRPVAQNNAQQSLRNATKLFQVAQAFGFAEEATTAKMEAVLADPSARRGVEEAIAAQAEHFDMPGLQLGYVYERGALVSDGSSPPQVANPVRDYVQSGRPGARMPHAWVERNGERISSLDLVSADAFTLFTCSTDGRWEAAVREVSAVPIRALRLGAEIVDCDGRFEALAGIGRAGALLVRPDQHVAWRATGLPAEPGAALVRALDEICAGGAAG